MKKLFAFLLPAVIILSFENTLHAQNSNSPSILRHIVMISFKQDAPADSIQALDDIYRGLSKSSFVKDFEMGINISTRDSGVVKHVYMTSFASKEDMDNYRKIPDYSKQFKASLPIASEVTVADYCVNK